MVWMAHWGPPRHGTVTRARKTRAMTHPSFGRKTCAAYGTARPCAACPSTSAAAARGPARRLGLRQSTLIRCLSGLEPPTPAPAASRSSARRCRRATAAAPDRALRRRIGVIFQQFNLVGRLGVMNNADRPGRRRAAVARPYRPLHAGAWAARSTLDTIGLAPQAFQRCVTLSGGQQQRAAIARDAGAGRQWPTTGGLWTAIHSARDGPARHPQPRRRALLIVSLHQVGLARCYCHRVLALRDDELVHDGPSAALTFLQQLCGTAADELLHTTRLRGRPPGGARAGRLNRSSRGPSVSLRQSHHHVQTQSPLRSPPP